MFWWAHRQHLLLTRAHLVDSALKRWRASWSMAARASNRTLFELNWIRTGWWLWSNNVQYSIFCWIYYWIYEILLLDLTTNIQYIWIDPMALFDVQISQMPKLEIASKRFRHFSKPCKANRLADAWQPMTRNDMSKGGRDALWNPSHFSKLVIPGILVMLAVKRNLSSNCILRSVNWDLKKPKHPDIYICRASIWKNNQLFFCRPDDVSVSCRSTAMAGTYACHDVCVAVVDNHGPHGILRCNSLSYLLPMGNYPPACSSPKGCHFNECLQQYWGEKD